MRLCKPADMNELPKYLKPEIAERVAEHFKNGIFEFELKLKETLSTIRFRIMRRKGRKACWISCAASWPGIWRKQNETC